MSVRINTNIRSSGIISIGPRTTGGGGGPVLENLTFPTVTNWQESPTNRWGPITYPWPGGAAEGRTNRYLEAGQDGYIQHEVDIAGNALFTGLDFALSNSGASPYYATAEYNVYVGNGNTYWWSYIGGTNGYNDSGIPANTGDILKIERIGSSFTSSYYRGGSWTPIHAFTETSSARVYVVGSSGDPGNAVYLLNPKGYNLI